MLLWIEASLLIVLMSRAAKAIERFVSQEVFPIFGTRVHRAAPVNTDQEEPGLISFVDQRGSFVVSSIYDYAKEFSEGLAALGSRRVNVHLLAEFDPEGTTNRFQWLGFTSQLHGLVLVWRIQVIFDPLYRIPRISALRRSESEIERVSEVLIGHKTRPKGRSSSRQEAYMVSLNFGSRPLGSAI